MIAVLVLGVVLVATTGGLLAATARPSTAVSYLLGTYLAGWATVVLSVAFLSAMGWLGRAGLLTTLVLALASAIVVWSIGGRPRPPVSRSTWVKLGRTLNDPVLALLAFTVFAAFAYAAVLGVATPQNEWDSLSYHLTRAAFWLQQGSVGYVSGTDDLRVNVNPPVAEIGQLVTLSLSRSDRFAWLPQYSAVAALCLATLGIARRLGFDVREALFGSLLLACLPLIVLQASTALNDLVVASFVATATYFALGKGKCSAAGALVALALGVGTKLVAVLLLPLYLAVVLVAGRRSPLAQVGIVAAGAAAGSAWYVLNLAETGSWDGGLASATDQLPDRGLPLVLTRVVQLSIDALELPGAVGLDRFVYPLAAIAMMTIGLLATRRAGRSAGFALALAGIVVAGMPVVIWCALRSMTWAWRWAWVASGRDIDTTSIAAHIAPATLSDSTGTWFGPVGVVLVIAGVVLALRSGTRGREWVSRVLLALMPLMLLVIVAVAVPYDSWRGRFLIYGMALASVVWGPAYRVRALAWGVSVASLVTVLLVLTHSFTKPPGIQILEPAAAPTVFGQPRWLVQTWIREGDGTDETLRFVERHVPNDATIGLALNLNDFVFPYFGDRLDRTVRLIPRGATVPADVAWVVEGPTRSVALCSGTWVRAHSSKTGFRVFRRTHDDCR